MSGDKERQVDNLVNIVENHTRTKRHLEQYADIGDPAFKEMAMEKQKVREEQIELLKDKLTGKGDVISSEEHFENLVDNYDKAIGYVENNFHNMSIEDLNNIHKKQENRKEQMKNNF